MFASRRLVPLFLAAFTTLVFFLLFQKTELTASLRHVPQAVGLGEQEHNDDELGTGGNNESSASHLANRIKSYPNPNSLFVTGTTKSPGADYSRTVVIPRLKDENIEWIEEELGDILYPNGPLQTAIYVVDDGHAALRIPRNKGHEV